MLFMYFLPSGVNLNDYVFTEICLLECVYLLLKAINIILISSILLISSNMSLFRAQYYFLRNSCFSNSQTNLQTYSVLTIFFKSIFSFELGTQISQLSAATDAGKQNPDAKNLPKILAKKKGACISILWWEEIVRIWKLIGQLSMEL